MGSLQRSFGELSLVERLKAKKNQSALLLDTSGSMNEECELGTRRIDALRAIVSGLDSIPSMFYFSTDCGVCTKNDIPNPRGNTILSKALDMVKKAGHKTVILITDGEVNSFDQSESLIAVSGIELKILYVGTGEKPEFLNKLANMSGGFCSSVELKEQKALTEKIQGLLGSGSLDSSIKL